ncbi:MAG TPA: hypothetical protein ENH10_01355 [Bacteroidetes bacterium]|nr:hypothetical protein [Bacteroidota bacterium]HEX03792.1 hypothetical protein [Bacteroidota bacterium]
MTWAKQAERYREFGEQSVPRLLHKHPDLEWKLSLSKLRFNIYSGFIEGVLQPLLLRLVCNDPVYDFVHHWVVRCRQFPWPSRVFDYMVFHLYSRSFARDLRQEIRP